MTTMRCAGYNPASAEYAEASSMCACADFNRTAAADIAIAMSIIISAIAALLAGVGVIGISLLGVLILLLVPAEEVNSVLFQTKRYR